MLLLSDQPVVNRNHGALLSRYQRFFFNYGSRLQGIMYLTQDYKHYSKLVLKIIYVPAALFWVFGRLILFPISCVYPALYGGSISHEFLTPSQEEVLGLPYKWMGYMLVALMVLQFFWTYYILKAFASVNVSTKVTNSYE